MTTVCSEKVYASRHAANREVHRMPYGLQAYRCCTCLQWHVGTPRKAGDCIACRRCGISLVLVERPIGSASNRTGLLPVTAANGRQHYGH